jgi:hypothetical protein
MNPEIKKIWVEALRSGKYKQGWGSLCQTIDGEDLYCCLGVLANECIEGEWEPCTVCDGEVKWAISKGYSKSFCYIPEELLIEIGIDVNDKMDLIYFNDNLGEDFKTIADWIEKNL